MSEPNRFAIVPIYSDSTGAEVKFPGAIMTGDMSAVMARIKDSKQMREDLRISNEAGKVRRAQAALRDRERELDARADSIKADRAMVNQKLMQDFSRKLDALTHRIDAIEAQRAYDPDPNERPSPPGYPDDNSVEPDDGELEAPKAPPGDHPDLPRSSIEDD